MSRVKMKAPEGASSFSIEGTSYDVVGGEAEVENGHVETARSFGFTLAAGEELPAMGGRPAMVQSIYSAARAVAESLSDDILNSFTSMSEENLQKFWEGMAKGIEEMPKMVAQQKSDEEADKAAEKAEVERLEAAKANEDAVAAAKKASDDKAAADAKAAAAEAAKKKA
jgi:hypothetical protein